MIVLSLAAWALARLLALPALAPSFGIGQIGYTFTAGLFGAGAAIAAAYFAARWARSAALRTVAAAFSNIDRLVMTVFRSSVLLTLVVEVSGFACCAGMFATCWVLKSAPPGAASDPSSVLLDTIQVLTSFTVGALLASFALQHSGTAYRIAAQMGTSVASKDANLADIDARNPSAIADTAGVQLGQLIPHILDAFCSVLCTNVLVVIVLWRMVGNSRLSTEHTYLLAPVIMRAFGAMASVFGAGAARSLEARSHLPAFLRTQAVFVVVAIGAIGGCSIWLTPDFNLRVSICGVLGLLFPMLMGNWQGFIVKRQLDQGKALRHTPENAWSSGVLLGITRLFVPLLALLGLLGFVLHVGESLPIVNGRIFALMVCVLGMNIAAPVALTFQSTFPLLVLARRAVSLAQCARNDEGQRRLFRLEEAARVASSWAMSVQTQCCIGLPLFAAFVFGTLAKDSVPLVFGIETLAAFSACSIALLLPLAFDFYASSRAGTANVNEVRRQLGSFPKESGVSRIPPAFTPSYRACVEVAAREANKQLSLPTALVLAPALLLGLTLIWTTKSPGLVGRVLAMYLGQVAVAAFVAGFIVEVATDFASTLRTRSSKTLALPDASARYCGFHHLATNGTPAVRLFAKTSVIAALTFVPYMI
jgi:hypothetical protein